MSEKITWMISVYCQKQDGFNIIVDHLPISRDAYSAAEAKGLGLDWLEEHRPSREWGGYSVRVCPVYQEDSDKLKNAGEPTY